MRYKDLPAHEQEELARLAERAERVMASPDLVFNPDAREPLLMELHRLRFQRVYNERKTIEAIAEARANGMSWVSLGAALGLTGEAVRKRYNRSQRLPAPALERVSGLRGSPGR